MVKLLFSFENAETFKDPVNIADDAKVLLPEPGDVVESSNSDRHIVTQRVFDWDSEPPSILLICVRSLPGPEEFTITTQVGEDGVTDGVTEDE